MIRKNEEGMVVNDNTSEFAKYSAERRNIVQRNEIVNSLERIDKKIDWILSFCKDRCVHNNNISKEI